MNVAKIILLAALSAWGATACAPKDTALTETQRAFCENLGIETSQALGKKLLAQLQGALASGDLTTAITVCQSAAQPITATASEQKPGVSIRRTSLKYRNPENAPDSIDREVLESWESSKEAIQGFARQTGTNAARYYAPIVVKEACLKCHGPRESLPETLTNTLDKLYPDDLAHGYALGDLRGTFRVGIDLTKAVPNSNP